MIRSLKVAFWVVVVMVVVICDRVLALQWSPSVVDPVISSVLSLPNDKAKSI